MEVEEYKQQTEVALAKAQRLQHLFDQAGWKDLSDEYDRWKKNTSNITESTSKEDFLASRKAVEIMGKFWKTLQNSSDTKGMEQDLKDIKKTKIITKTLQEQLK